MLYNPQCNTRSTDESNSTVLGLRITTRAFCPCVRYKSFPVLEEILGLRHHVLLRSMRFLTSGLCVAYKVNCFSSWNPQIAHSILKEESFPAPTVT